MPVKPPLPFLEQLRESQLLKPQQLEELGRRPEAGQADPLPLARQAVQRGWLTKFQAQAVLQGRAGDLSVGPYLLLEKLGEGGMGQVFKARHRHMDRVVALKLIRKETLSKPESVKRFYQEVRAAGALAHRNIVVAYDAGQAGATHFIAMEYVEGSDLGRLVKESGPLSPSLACGYIRQAAQGLQHAFERGLVHRDIKPANLLVSREVKGGAAGGVVKVLDLGLARLRDAGAQGDGLTKDGAVLGTPDYLAPEQAADARSADVRSDLYGLGCTLYYLLAGRAPFAGGSLTEVLLKHQLEEPPPLQGVPGGVSQVVAKLLAKRPEDRYQTPAQLAEVLQPFCSEDGCNAEPPRLAGKRRDTAPAESPTFSGMDATVTFVPAPGVSRTEGDSASSRRLARRPAPGQRSKAGTRQRRLWTWVAIGGSVCLVAMLVLLSFLVKGRRSDQPARPAGETLQVTTAAPAKVPAVASPVMPPPASKPPQPIKPVALPPAPSGRAGEIRQFLGHTAGVERVAFSPDGRSLVSGGQDKTIRLWEVETGREIRSIEGHADGVRYVTFSPDGRRILSASADKTIRLWDVQTGAEVRRWPGQNSVVWCAVFSADGRRILSGSADGTARLWDVESGNEIRQFRGHRATVNSVALSADGRRALTASWDTTARSWDVETGREICTFANHRGMVCSIVCLPDNHRALSGATDGSLCLWDVETGEQVRRFPTSWGIWIVSVSPDGLRALSGCMNRNLQLWDVEKGELIHNYLGHASGVSGAAFSPDGRRFASGSHDRTIRLWEVAGGATPGKAKGAGTSAEP